MKQGLQHRPGWDALLKEIECCEKLAVALVRPTHSTVAARAKQSGIEHLADIVIGRGKGGEGAIFTVAHKRG